MKKKPAILFLLPVLLLLLSGSSLKAGAADRATTALFNVHLACRPQFMYLYYY